MRWGPSNPQITEAEKKTLAPGQVKCCFCSFVQTPSMLLRAKFRTKTWTKQETVVATTWAVNIVRGGIFM